MIVKIGERKFKFERTSAAINCFYIREIIGRKKAYVGGGFFLFGEKGEIYLGNIELKPQYRGTLRTSLIRNSYRFFAKAFPDRAALTKLIKGRPQKKGRIDLKRFRKRRRMK